MKYNDALRGLLNQEAGDLDAVTNAEIKYNIYKTLQRAADAEAHGITINRQGGRVTLRGTARTWLERQEMEDAAKATPGVMEVTNEIKLAA